VKSLTAIDSWCVLSIAAAAAAAARDEDEIEDDDDDCDKEGQLVKLIIRNPIYLSECVYVSVYNI